MRLRVKDLAQDRRVAQVKPIEVAPENIDDGGKAQVVGGAVHAAISPSAFMAASTAGRWATRCI
ncbi:hypothetical protein D3C87_2050660 [compost metagenome]